MGSETATRNKVMKWLESKGCHCQKHEDALSVGIPDLSFGSPKTARDGWIEFKQRDKPPVRPSTPVELKLTHDQKTWIALRGKITQRVWVIAQIGETYFIFDWMTQITLNTLTYAEMEDSALWLGEWRHIEELWDILL